MCREVLGNQRPQNLHIFVNSVEFIADVIQAAGLVPKQVKVVCSTSGDNAVKNERKLGSGFPISQPSDPVKKINFYTSTCFEGCDIFDRDGVTCIVSDGRKANTLLDISTMFTQICGRVRDSQYKGKVYHIYSTTRYSTDVSLQEFEQATYDNYTKAVRYADEINGLSEETRIRTLSKIPCLNEPYIIVEGNTLVADKTLADIDVLNFKISRQIYRSYKNLSNEMQANGYRIVCHSFSKIVETINGNSSARLSFQELFDEYARLKADKAKQPMFTFENNEAGCNVIAVKNPLVKQAYDLLGVDKVRGLKYHVGNIERELLKYQLSASESNVVSLVDKRLPQLAPIVKKRVKEELQQIYDTLGIKQIAKATDLEK